MAKLFKSALGRVMEQTRRKPFPIEIQIFFADAVRIVNDRPLTILSDQPNDFCPITPSSFLGQQLAPNTLPYGLHNQGDLRKDYSYNSTLAHGFWLLCMKSYLPSLQSQNKWRTLQTNLEPVQLVLVGDNEDLASKGAYGLKRIQTFTHSCVKGKK